MFPQNYISLHSKIRLSRKWGTVGTLPTPPQIEMGHPRNTSNTQKASWGTIGTLPTPPQIEMGHPWNPSNTPSD